MHVTADDGCRLFAVSNGNAAHAPLILLNSLGTDVDLWDAQIGDFARQFHVLRYDTRGHGRSEVPPGNYSIERLGRDVLTLMDHGNIARAHLCGISIGGLTALWLATHTPERVDRLVLANTAARIGQVPLWDERIALVRREGVAALADATMSRWLTAAFRAREPHTVERIRRTFVSIDNGGYVGCCAALRDADLRSDAARVAAPTLVVTGTHDPATPPGDGQWLSEQIAGSQYVELPAAHLSNVERAADFNHAVLTFLGARTDG
jgi:3-oxoadipate enol-lactonase